MYPSGGQKEVIDDVKKRCIAMDFCVAHLIQIDCSLLALRTQLGVAQAYIQH